MQPHKESLEEYFVRVTGGAEAEFARNTDAQRA